MSNAVHSSLLPTNITVTNTMVVMDQVTLDHARTFRLPVLANIHLDRLGQPTFWLVSQRGSAMVPPPSLLVQARNI